MKKRWNCWLFYPPSPAIRLEAFANINPKEEIADDLIFHFAERYQSFIEQDYLSGFVATEILEINQTFANYSIENHESSWSEIGPDKRWNQLLLKDKNIFITLDKSDLEIEISTTYEAR